MNGQKNRGQEWRRQQGSRLLLGLIVVGIIVAVGVLGVSTDVLGPVSTVLQTMLGVE